MGGLECHHISTSPIVHMQLWKVWNVTILYHIICDIVSIEPQYQPSCLNEKIALAVCCSYNTEQHNFVLDLLVSVPYEADILD